ncbi:hypothetical protein [Anthocerotibacter panamensis]|uniref:hypothetical protein n=1 Tax=Anthocerotibacter panamensis TaxID=2857077 RepID=UPI001C4029BF|nr:hypothetical protein [Anthocerotibacter panamensis]
MSEGQSLETRSVQRNRQLHVVVPCPRCGSSKTRVSHRATLADQLWSLVYKRPYRCQVCQARFHAASRGGRRKRKILRQRLLRVSLVFLAVMGLGLGGVLLVFSLKPQPPYSVQSRLDHAQTALDTTLTNAQIRSALAGYGYTPERLSQGKALYEAALAAQKRQQTAYADQLAITERLNQVWDAADDSYQRLVKIARVAFKNNAGLGQQLALDSPRQEDIALWLKQVQRFYATALQSPQVLQGLSIYSITPAKVQAAQGQLRAVEEMVSTLQTQKNRVREVNELRDRALKVLDDWIEDFTAIAEVALEGQPQLLNSLELKKGVP